MSCVRSASVLILLAGAAAACTNSEAPQNGTLGVSPAVLTFSATQGGANPADQTIEITESGAELTWSASKNAAWLTLTPTSGNAPASVAASVAIAGLTAGTHNATITVVSSDASNSPQTMAVTLTISAGLILSFITAGDYHSCGATVAGAAYCWGRADFGMLGNNTIASSSVRPVAVAGGQLFAVLTAGDLHTCGLNTTGSAFCWGLNDRGQLGDGTTTNRSAPVAVSGGLSFSALSASGKAQLGSHTCGRVSNGDVYCWGYNTAGQLGDGSTTQRTSPVKTSGGLSFASVTAGGFHTCGLTGSGVAYCWGLNDSGQLGDGTQTQRLAPVPVSGGLSFASLNAGGDHTCGVTTAGAAYCWGANFLYGQLGDGTTTRRTSPVLVTGGQTFTTASAGGLHSCAFKSDGAAFCWGDNFHGQLGDGSNTVRTAPVAVTGGLAFVQLIAGSGGAGGVGNGAHTCGLTASGAAYCWGLNDRGQLGDGTQTNRSAPVRVVP